MGILILYDKDGKKQHFVVIRTRELGMAVRRLGSKKILHSREEMQGETLLESEEFMVDEFCAFYKLYRK